MTCREIQQNLPAYLENLLPEEEKQFVRKHLASCVSCRKALEDLKSMENLLHNLDEVTPPPWLKQKILAQVQEENQKEKGFFRKLFAPMHFKIPLQAAALLLITVLAFYLYRGEEPELRNKGIGIALPPMTSEQGIKESEKSRKAVPSQLTPQKESSLPGKSQITKEIQSEPVKLADGEVLALKKDFSQKEEGERKRENVKEKIFSGEQDYSSPALQAERRINSQFQAQQNDIVIASRAEEKDMGRTALPFRPSAGIRTMESKATKSAVGKTTQARDGNRAVQETLTLLQQFDASKIERRISGEREILTAELPSRNLKPFLQKLEADLGETKKNVSIGTEDSHKETVEIRIDLFKNP